MEYARKKRKNERGTSFLSVDFCLVVVCFLLIWLFLFVLEGGADPDVSAPFNVAHKVHVDTDFQWSGSDVFEVECKLGEG